MKTRALPFLWLLIALLTSPLPAWGIEAGGAAAVDLDADELDYDRATDSWSARGEVRLQKGELTLLADRIRFHPTSGEAEAAGAVRVSGPEGDLRGEGLLLNVESGAGRVVDGHLLVREGNYHIAGELIERFSEQRYRIRGGTFTTCDAEPPAWKFSARQLDVTVGGYARARHVFFYIHDIPVLYTPFLAYPVKTERESGFLMPRIGSSNTRGFQFSLAWYQVIDRHLDATFSLDYLSRLGIGKGAEYRYILGQESEGISHLYHVTGLAEGSDRWAFDWQHAGPLPGEVRLVADVEYVSSRDYYEDFGVEVGEYNKDQAQSVLALSRLWPKYSLTGQAKYTKDLREDNDDTLQKLPETVFVALPQRLGDTPFFLALDAGYTHFWRREGVKGTRLIVRPELSAAFHPGELLDVRSAIGYRERLYWTSEEGPGYEQQGIYDFSTRVSTRFSRVFAFKGGALSAIRHSIEPEVAWHYIPAENQSQLPRFDLLDRIEPANRLAYALINRFTARLQTPDGTPYYHDFAYLRLSQEYDIRAARDDPPPGEPERPFTPLRIE
ncbi:MAG: LPS-assembly protein LptD, partial [Desulfuromonadales bacterium]|nr:LPS-assembly protein LptD [Desulfuromonadales bacterium]